MDSASLRKLDSAVDHLLGEASFATALGRLEEQLARSTEPFVWATVDLSSIPVELPDEVKSGWIFHLRENVRSGAHYHPNSVQHMVVVAGQGLSDISGERRSLVSFASPSASLEDRWLIIGRGVAHEFIPEGDDMTVVSFHTCAAEELEEVECDTSGLRHYAGGAGLIRAADPADTRTPY